MIFPAGFLLNTIKKYIEIIHSIKYNSNILNLINYNNFMNFSTNSNYNPFYWTHFFVKFYCKK